MMKDELADAAKLIVDKFEWPLDLQKSYPVSGPLLLLLRNALAYRDAFSLYELAQNKPCTKCGALSGEPCRGNSGVSVHIPHKQRMRVRCLNCQHMMYGHSRRGQCLTMESNRKICRCPRFVYAEVQL